MEKLRIGLIGLGTVGTGVYKSLKDFGNIEIVKIAEHPAGFHMNGELRIRAHIRGYNDERLLFIVKFTGLYFVNLFHGVASSQFLYIL